MKRRIEYTVVLEVDGVAANLSYTEGFLTALIEIGSLIRTDMKVEGTSIGVIGEDR